MNVTEILIAVISLIIGIFIGGWGTRMYMRHPFRNNPVTGIESLVGKEALVTKVKEGYAEVTIDSQIWAIIPPDGEPLTVGQKVYIKGLDGNRLSVSRDPIPRAKIPRGRFA